MTHPIPAPGRRAAIVVMGVSGSGKSTVGAAIAARQGLGFVDGDSLHSAASVARMQAGIPLQDEDRWPWLDRVGACLADAVGWPRGVVIACSALKRSYRTRIRVTAPSVRFVFLDGSAAVIAPRMATRRGHYMPGTLLESQLRTLERPGADEPDVVRVDIDADAARIVDAACAALAAAAA